MDVELNKWELAVLNSALGVALVSIEGYFLEANPKMCEIFGYSEDELKQLTFQELTHPEDLAEGLAADLKNTSKLVTGDFQSYSTRKRYLDRFGKVIHAILIVTLVKGLNPPCYIAQVQPVDELKAVEQRLRVVTFRDELTKLYNRSYFKDALENELEKSRKFGRSLVLALIDLNSFKSINDQYGHAAGDEVLRVVASRLKSIVRPLDTVARWGGDEFLIMFPDTDLHQVRTICSQLQREIAAPINYQKAGRQLEFNVTCAIGIALSDSFCTSDELIKEADKSMHLNKIKT